MATHEKVVHFGVSLKKTERMQINRENYAVIDKVSSGWNPRIGELRKSAYKTEEARRKTYDDEECRIYSDAWCKQWREKCLYNYDLNMAFFNNLKDKDFEKALSKLLKSIRKMREITNLAECSGMSGIYVMILDKYKQMYIGQSSNIKSRIMGHWSKKMSFDRLIYGYGKEESSVLSIDSFGALDTTRIFVLETDDLDDCERKIVNKVPDIFKLNRVGGGMPTDAYAKVEILANTNNRKLK